MTVQVTLPLDLIEVRERTRTELRQIDGLATSIGARGLLHPPVVRRDGDAWVLVAGLRRLAALRQLGWDKMLVTVAVALTDERAALHAEGEENTCREPFTPSEAVRHAERITAVEQRLAKERQQEGQEKGRAVQHGKVDGADSAQTNTPAHERKSRARTAKAVGMSHATLAKARDVVEAAEAEPERYGDLPARMDTTGKVEPAWQELNRRQVTHSAEQVGDDGAIARARLLRDFHGGCRAFTRDLLPLDPQALADALTDDDDRYAAGSLIRQMRGWLDQLDRELHGFKVIQGGKA
jgi:hypothetical protein